MVSENKVEKGKVKKGKGDPDRRYSMIEGKEVESMIWNH